MKWLLSRPSALIVTLAFGSFALSLWTTRQLDPSGAESETKKIIVSAAYDPAALATAPINRVKLGPKQTRLHLTPQSALRADRELVEVLSRSITFPPVLSQGDLVLNADFSNAATLCLVAANYSGRAQGLIWAMDRGTVERHGLFWIIDLAGTVFDECFEAIFYKPVTGGNGDESNQLQDVKDRLTRPIELIQAGLRYAKLVRIEPSGVATGVSFPTAERIQSVE